MLLKNGKTRERPLLPLPKKVSKILVAGSHADNLGYQCGGWTMTKQGQSGNNLTTGIFLLHFLYMIHVTPYVIFTCDHMILVFNSLD